MPTIIAAPYPNIKVTSVLPVAQFRDSQSSEQAVKVVRSMIGGTRTYVKSGTRRRVSLPLLLSRMKMLELQEFIRIYYRAEWLITLHDNTQWVSSLVVNPFLGRVTSRAGGWPGGEAAEFDLELSVKPYHPLLF